MRLPWLAPVLWLGTLACGAEPLADLPGVEMCLGNVQIVEHL